MSRVLALVAAGWLVALAPPAQAQSQLELLVAQELREFGFDDVDVRTLSSAQLAAIHSIAHLKRNRGGKRALIQSTLGGRNTLRGLLGINS